MGFGVYILPVLSQPKMVTDRLAYIEMGNGKPKVEGYNLWAFGRDDWFLLQEKVN